MHLTVDAKFVWVSAFAEELTRLRSDIDPKALLKQAEEAFAQFGATWTPTEAAHLWTGRPGDQAQYEAPDDLNY